MITSTSLLLLIPVEPSSIHLRAGKLLALIVSIVSLLRFCEYLPGWPFSISNLLFSHTIAADTSGLNVSNRMAPNTAFLFLTMSAGLLTIHGQTNLKRFVTPLMGSITFLGALVTLIVYLYRIQLFYGTLAKLPMAIHTGVCFLLLGVALLFSQPGSVLMKEIVSTFSGGSSARLLWSAAVILPLGLGLLTLYGYWSKAFTAELAIGIHIFLLIVLFCLLIWRNTRELNRRDRQKAVANRLLESTNQSLLEMNEELERFAYVSSHDLQEPLRKIRMYCSLLRKDIGKSADAMESNVEKIDAAATRMSSLIQDLLYLTRVRQSDDRFVQTDLHDILVQVLNDYEATITEKTAIIKTSTLPSLPAIPTQMTQLFSNIIGNALKFTNTVPIVTVDSREATSEDLAMMPHLIQYKRYLIISISDNGIGFEQAYADKIFVMFQRLNSKKSFNGSGIGLAICKRIALNHSGDMRATGEVNKGATFHVYLLWE